jgi:cytochrome P450
MEPTRVSYDHHAAVTDDERLSQYAHLRGCPVAHSDIYGGFHVVSRHDEVVDVLLDWRTYSSADGVFLPDLTEGVRTAALEQDPPGHTPVRLLYGKMLSRANIDRAVGAIRDVARGHIDRLAAEGGDFVTVVAQKVPVEAVALMVGFSGETVGQVRYLSEQLWARLTGLDHLLDPDAPPLSSVFLRELQARRDDPTDDFLTQLTELTPDDLDGEPVTDRFLVAFLTGAMVAGHETTMNASANLAHQLSIDPALQERLAAEPDLISGAIDESLRHRAPVQNFVRTATTDTELNGCPVKAGDKVMVIYGAANHDPDRWDEPETFDPSRSANGHLGFGWGIHRCIGAPFAKIELQIIFEELLGYRVEPAGAAIPGAPTSGGAFLGMESLPLKLERR